MGTSAITLQVLFALCLQGYLKTCFVFTRILDGSQKKYIGFSKMPLTIVKDAFTLVNLEHI